MKKRTCQWVVALESEQPANPDLLQPPFLSFCYNKAVASVFTGDGVKVGRVCRKHVKAARLEKFNIERIK